MSQMTVTLGQGERVREICPSVYVFNFTAAGAICKVAQKYIDEYYDGSENDYFELSKMYPKNAKGEKLPPYVDIEKRLCYTAGMLKGLHGEYSILHELVWDTLIEMKHILAKDLGIGYHFRSGANDELLIYPDGRGYFDFHQDTREGGRTGTYLFYVNDNYEGGEIEFKNIRDSEGERVRYKPKKGEMLMMPTTWHTEHRSLANTAGEKIYILAQMKD